MKKLCIKSSIDSVEENYISLVGVVETLIATALCFSLLRTDYVYYLLVSFVLSPILMLRSRKASELSIDLMGRFDKYWLRIIGAAVEKLEFLSLDIKNAFLDDLIEIFLTFVFNLLLMLPYVIFLFVAKALSVIYCFLVSPLKTIRQIPANWFKLVFSVDVFHPPELIPSVEYIYKSEQDDNSLATFVGAWRWSKLGRVFSKDYDLVVKICILSCAFLIYLPVVFYRWLFKSTFLLYSPFIWILRDRHGCDSEGVYYSYVLHSQLERIKLIWSLIVLIIYMVMPIYYLSIIYSVDGGGVIDKLMGYWVPIYEVKSWNVTQIVSAVITIGVFVGIEKLTYFNAEALKSDIVRGLFSFLNILRDVCVLWTVFCGVYIAVNIVRESEMAFRFFPF